ncbi:MAG: UbiA family prenyltransferase [Bacteroidota bacterium]
MSEPRSALVRWGTYLQERFPLQSQGVLVAVFAGGALCAAHLLRDVPGWPPAAAFAVAALVVLGFFFQLRVADEFKDAEADRQYRPLRPVPRGLVTLRALAAAGLGVAVVQLALVVLFDLRLLPYLGLVWGFGALMSVEFFARTWLEERPWAVLVSHGLVVPLIALFAAACDGWAAWPGGLGRLLAASWFTGTVIEVGRKVRAPDDEELGVETYSAAWGRGRAVSVWLGAVGLACGAAVGFGAAAGTVGLVAGALAPVLLLCVGAAVQFLRRPVAGAGRWIEGAAALWTLALYVVVGPLALLLR